MSKRTTQTCNRRDFMKTGAAALSVSAAMVSSGKETSRPNFLIIVTDQQNIDTISGLKSHFEHPAYGCHWVNTPNLDRLLQRGVAFIESHSANPVCCPARSAIFTGRMSIETGVTYNNIGIDKSVPNMGQWLEENTGYTRVYCGKWHAGGKWNYPEVSGPRKVPGFEILPVGARDTGDAADYQVSSSVEAFIRNYDDVNPFVIVAGLMNPHDVCFWSNWNDDRVITSPSDTFGLGERLPILPPNNCYDFAEPEDKRYRKFNDMQWRNCAYDYYRMIEKIDGDVGRMLKAVESRKDNTIIIFTADHGEGLGRHSRIAKWHPYEHSVKVPLIVSCPGLIDEGIIDDQHLVSGVDVMATVCDYADAPLPPHCRGRSLRPLIEGDGEVSWRNNVYAEMAHIGRMIRTERFKYVKYYEFSGETDSPFVTADGNATQFVPGRGEDYRENPIRLLFDIKNDPWETKNLYDDSTYASVLREHETILREQWEARLLPGTHYDRN